MKFNFALAGMLLISISGTLFAQRPRNTPYRLEEDWSFLKDPAQRTDPLDPLKYIPLGGEAWLTLGGEFRHRYEYFNNDAWGTIAPDDDNGYHLLRAMLFADLHLGRDFRLFTELSSTVEEGKTTPRKPTERDELDLHQAFVEGTLRPAEAVDEILLRGGRQELNYGSGRLITFRDGPNTRLAFDAALVRAVNADWTVDAFYGRPVEIDPGIFDDQDISAQFIGGLYGVARLGADEPATLDLYLLAYGNDEARFVSGIGDEERYSIGSRLSGLQGSLDYNFEAVAQWGDFAGKDIRAWTVASDSGWTFADLPWSPRVFLKANIISGDDDPADGRLGTFNAMHPRGSYFGEIGLIGPANLINLHPGITAKLSAEWSITLGGNFFWREDTGDGIYNPGGALIRMPAGSNARHIGNQLDSTIAWSPTPTIFLEFTYSRFFAGSFLSETGPSENVDYVSMLTRFRF